MQNLQALPDDIRQQLKKFDSVLQASKSLKGFARQKALLFLDKNMKMINNNIKAYQYSIQSGLLEEKVTDHRSQLKQLKKAVINLQKGLEMMKDDVGGNGLFDKKTNINIDLNNKQTIISEGNRAQQQSQQILKDIQQKVGNMNNRADDITIEMNRQIQELDKIYNDLNDTNTTLARAQQHLKYFAKQIYTDRLMICMIIVIALAIIVIVALAIAGKTPKSTNTTVK